MPSKNKSKWVGLAFLSFLASFPVFVGIYFSDPGNTLFFQRTGMLRSGGTSLKKESRILENRVVLLKDSSIIVNDTRLVYKGLYDKHIFLEYYLLELDPECPYQNRISPSQARIGIRMGDSVFHLVSVGRTALTLQIDHIYKAL